MNDVHYFQVEKLKTNRTIKIHLKEIQLELCDVFKNT